MTAVTKDKNGNYEGHAFNLAMLEAKLQGNHMKVILAYMNIGGFNLRDAVYLARKDYERFGIVRQTLSILRQELIQAGWLVYAAKRSVEEYPDYYVRVGGPVAKRDRGRKNSRHLLSEKTKPPLVNCDREITSTNKRLDKELINT